MGETITIRTGAATEVIKVIEAGPQGPVGPKGDPGDVAGLPLTTAGDTLYRANSTTNARLPIGTTGQVLKVVAGLPAWAEDSGGVSSWNDLTDKPSTFAPSAHTHPISDVTNLQSALDGKAASSHTHTASAITDFNTAAAAAAPVQSVAGRTGAVTLAVADVSGAVASTDTRLTDSRQPTLHGSTHHTGGTDAIAAHQINGQTIFSASSAVYSADQSLPANRARQLTVSNTNASGITLTLPTQAEGTLNGDTYVIVGGNTMSGPITVRGVANLSPLVYNTLVTITATGQQYRLRSGGGSSGNWSLIPVDTHTHAGSQVNVGTTANLPLRTGTNGVVEAGAFGTAAASFCEGNDARLSDARTPSSTLAHKASHATGGTDALAPSDIGAQSIFARSEDDVPASGPLQLSAARAAIFSVRNARSEARDVYLPMTSIQNGDIIVVVGGGTLTNPINIKVPAASGAAIVDPNGGAVTISVTGQQYRFIVDGVGNFIPWTRVNVDTHTHVVAEVTGAAASGSITTSGLTQATARILGRTTASTGAIEEIQIGSGLSLSAGELSATGGSGGGEVRSDFVSPYTYTGLADAGTSESTASWLIRRSEFDAGGSFVATLTASAVQWANRLTASYA